MQQQINFSQVAEISIHYRRPQIEKEVKVSSSKDVYNLLYDYYDEFLDYREAFNVLYLNKRNEVLGIFEISKGGTSGTVADPKMIFQGALKANAASIILSHNHPSGNTQPSDSDIKLTGRLKKVGVLLELPILDHIIVTRKDYYSFADNGNL